MSNMANTAGRRLEKVKTSDLEPGLYVQQLDRPWTETPFLFQGFFVNSRSEINELSRYCKYVFVDPIRKHENRAYEAKIHDQTTQQKTIDTRQNAPHGTAADPARGALYRSPDPPVAVATSKAVSAKYVPTRKVESEIGAAETIHYDACHAINRTLSRLKSDKSLDMDTIAESVKSIMESIFRNPDAMIWLSRMRTADAYLYQHSINCAIWGMAFARHLGLGRNDIYQIGLGCTLLDVGKTRVPGELLKRAGPVSENEFRVMKAHVEYGVAIVEQSGRSTERTIQMVYMHHERFNGRGYPDGLKGDEIAIYAKIGGVVDSYDAMLSPRPYAHQKTPYEAVREIYRWRDTLFQAEVVEQFIQVIGAFPTGTLVELNTGAVGVVIAQNQTRRLRPRIMLLLDENKRKLPGVEIIDLMDDSTWNSIGELWIDRQLPPGSYGIDPQTLYL